jgi:hypothetical protein
MDPERAARITTEAKAALDRAERSLERRTLRDPTAPDVLEAWQRRRVELAPQPEPKPLQRNTMTMNAETQRGWDAWARTLIRDELGRFAEGLGAEVGSGEEKLRAEIAKLHTEHAIEIRTLKTALEEVRSELAAARTPLARRRTTPSRTHANH